MPRKTTYSKEQIETIFDMKQKGYKYREIAEKVGKTPKAIELFVSKYRKREEKNKEPEMVKPLFPVPASMLTPDEPKVKQKTIADFSARELIRSLYDRGYRIEDNTLVCYVKTTVQLKEIIS